MAFNAQEFRSRLKYAGYRPNLFEIKMTIPDSAAASEQISFMAESSSSPAYVVGFADAYFYGRRVSFFGDRNYSDWSVTCLCDETFDVRSAMESWQDRGSRANWQTDHIEQSNGLPLYSDASILAYGKEGEVLREIKMFNAFPIMIGPIEHSWSEQNQISRFSVDFRFDYAEVVNVRG